MDGVLAFYMKRIIQCGNEIKPPCIITVSYNGLGDKKSLERLGSLARRGVAVRVLVNA